MSQIHLETLDAILEKHQCDPSQVIAIMQDIQKEYHYLPESALCYTARKLGISDAKIYGVALSLIHISSSSGWSWAMASACWASNSASVPRWMSR